MVVIGIICIVLLSLNQGDIKKDNSHYKGIQENLTKKPFQSIHLRHDKCVSPEVALLDLKFPGTIKYCVKNGVASSECNSGHGVHTTLPPIQSFELPKYKGSFLCAVPSDQTIDTVTVAENTCPNNLKQCGVDSNNYKLCFDLNKPCPINDIIFSDEIRMDLQGNYHEEVFNLDTSKFPYQKMTPHYYLYYTNKAVDKPLVVQWRAGFKTVCLSPDEEVTDLKQFAYF